MKAKKKSKGSSVSTEAAIIEASVSYCANAAAATAAFNGDPTGGSTFAERRCDYHSEEAKAQLRKLIDTRATSAVAISAKARACAVLAEDIGIDWQNKLWMEVFQTFAWDVKEYVKETITAEYRSELEAKRGGGSK